MQQFGNWWVWGLGFLRCEKFCCRFYEFAEFVSGQREKSVRDQIAGCGFQNLGGITVRLEGRLESGLGFEKCRICEVLCSGLDCIESWIYILGERGLSVAIWGLA